MMVCRHAPVPPCPRVGGSGWCYNEADCLGRAGTPLGSSKTWAAEAAHMGCNPSGSTSYVRV